MKVSKLIYSLCLVLLSSGAFAQNLQQEITEDKSFKLDQGDRVEIRNKYGEIIVHTWYVDSVKVVRKFEIAGKNYSSVRKVINRVDMSMRKIGNLVSIETEVEKPSGGFFGDLLDDFEDASKGAFANNNKFSVDYEVWIPEDVDITIENRFGDVYLSDLTGYVDVELSHGDLRGNRIENRLELKQSFGRCNFDFVNMGEFNLRAVNMEVKESRKLTFESSSSEIELDEIENLQINSRNDKFYVESLDNVQGTGSFTDLNVDELYQNSRLDFSYGDIYLRQVAQNFKLIDISGKSTDINLVLDQASYIQTRIEGPEERMILPNSMLTLQRQELEDGKSISLNGTVGNTNSEVGSLNVIAKGGKLIIAIQETPIFTKQD